MASILVVDDEHEICAAIEAILEDEGHTIELCSDGRAALDRLIRGPVPDLLLSDIMMPRLNGLDLLEQIRANRALRSLRVILMSAVHPATDATGKWDDFIKKPFHLDVLIEAVQRQVGGEPARGR